MPQVMHKICATRKKSTLGLINFDSNMVFFIKTFMVIDIFLIINLLLHSERYI